MSALTGNRVDDVRLAITARPALGDSRHGFWVGSEGGQASRIQDSNVAMARARVGMQDEGYDS